MKRKTIAMTASAGVAAGALGLAPLALPAGAADPELPNVAPKALVASVMRAEEPAMSGKVSVTNNLGLPAIPGMNGASEALTAGSSSLRVWSDGQGRHRASMPSDGGEVTVVDDGNTTWKWNSTEQAVTKYEDKPSGAEQEARPAPNKPDEAARHIIDKLRQSSEVTVDGTTTVAGRDAYELVLTPKPTERTMLREVRVAVGAEHRIPLRVEVNANGSEDAAFRAGFTEINMARPDAELFQFTPPEGAEVKRPEQEADRPKTDKHPKPKVIGSGWDTVLVSRVPEKAMTGEGARDNGESDRSGPMAGGLRGMAEQAGKPVSGSWGRGWVINTGVGSALITEDGRVAAGAVPTQVLTEAIRGS